MADGFTVKNVAALVRDNAYSKIDSLKLGFQARLQNTVAGLRATQESLPNQFPFSGNHAPYKGDFMARMDGFKKSLEEQIPNQRKKIKSELNQ